MAVEWPGPARPVPPADSAKTHRPEHDDECRDEEQEGVGATTLATKSKVTVSEPDGERLAEPAPEPTALGLQDKR